MDHKSNSQDKLKVEKNLKENMGRKLEYKPRVICRCSHYIRVYKHTIQEKLISYPFYRNPKLTHILQSTLSGNALICVISTINPTGMIVLHRRMNLNLEAYLPDDMIKEYIMGDAAARCEEVFAAQIGTHKNKIGKMTLHVEQLQDKLSIMESLNAKKKKRSSTGKASTINDIKALQLKCPMAEESEDSEPNKTESLFVKKLVFQPSRRASWSQVLKKKQRRLMSTSKFKYFNLSKRNLKSVKMMNIPSHNPRKMYTNVMVIISVFESGDPSSILVFKIFFSVSNMKQYKREPKLSESTYLQAFSNALQAILDDNRVILIAGETVSVSTQRMQIINDNFDNSEHSFWLERMFDDDILLCKKFNSSIHSIFTQPKVLICEFHLGWHILNSLTAILLTEDELTSSLRAILRQAMMIHENCLVGHKIGSFSLIGSLVELKQLRKSVKSLYAWKELEVDLSNTIALSYVDQSYKYDLVEVSDYASNSLARSPNRKLTTM
ncbi:uncharacterized protein EV154DRAFT_480292 [Mucor mucedo]|uniref:uncharacterized protein n=1 Tax=Mucor mucedo TaxID=29922 RepID=UPI00221F7D1B|nr:uncharacterized protein EV154DRAFT_480292 [Mucor mucedo]KAI7892347.1 hypothetical protein EV154DRAFT_480292 [Mucor mucedo]